MAKTEAMFARPTGIKGHDAAAADAAFHPRGRFAKAQPGKLFATRLFAYSCISSMQDGVNYR